MIRTAPFAADLTRVGGVGALVTSASEQARRSPSSLPGEPIMPTLDLRHEIACDEDTYWSKVMFDPDFNQSLYRDELKFPNWALLDQQDGDAKLTRRVQVDPPVTGLPTALKKVIGDRLSYVEEGTFDKKTKRYTFKVTPSTLADKTSVTGELWAEKLGDGKIARMCRMRVDVKVFMVGSMIEERILSDLRAAYDKGASYTNEWLAKKGG